jgi:PAB1-binding protein PBP1
VKSSYKDDNSSLYTVVLDKNSKQYKENLAKADKLAEEIEKVLVLIFHFLFHSRVHVR